MRDQLLLALQTILYDRLGLAKKLANTFDNLEHLIRDIGPYWQAENLSLADLDIYQSALKKFDYPPTQAKLDRHGIAYVSIDSPAYSPLLREISDPPLVLFYKGNIGLLATPCMGIVGPRKASDYGLLVTRQLVKDMGHRLTTVSGMAEGIDTAVHHTALSCGLNTIAVMGTSFDTIYPASNRNLFDTLCQKGLVLSEYPFGTPSKLYHFPKRNRLISGLSLGVLVCEAGEKSGSLITARFAVEQNREVFAVPGSIVSPQTKGVHRLIQDGAKLVHDVDDIFQELQISPAIQKEQSSQTVTQPQPDPVLNPVEKQVWDLLSHVPQSVDYLAQKSGLMVHQILQVLTILELQQLIVQVDGHDYIKQ